MHANISDDSWVESEDSILYGAVTTGDIWQFGSFHRSSRVVTEHLMLYLTFPVKSL